MTINEAVNTWLSYEDSDRYDEDKSRKVIEARITIREALRRGYKIINVPDQHWIVELGGTSQFCIHMEECAELIQAISKYIRNSNTNKMVVEEMADVLICMEQLKIMCNISEEELQEEIKKKCDRTLQRFGCAED